MNLSNKNDDLIKYTQNTNTFSSSYDENEELDRCNSLNNNEALYTINKLKNMDELRSIPASQSISLLNRPPNF